MGGSYNGCNRRVGVQSIQGVTKRSRLSWLTNSALVYEPKCGGGGEAVVAGSQPMRMSTAVHWSPHKLWRSNFIFKLYMSQELETYLSEESESTALSSNSAL